MKKIFRKYYLLWFFCCLFSFSQILAVSTNHKKNKLYTAFIHVQNITYNYPLTVNLSYGIRTIPPANSLLIDAYWNLLPNDDTYIKSNLFSIFLPNQIGNLSVSSSDSGPIASGQLLFRIRTDGKVEIDDKTKFKIMDSLVYKIDGIGVKVTHTVDIDGNDKKLNIYVTVSQNARSHIGEICL